MKKKQMSVMKKRLIAGGLILVIVACWIFIGVSVTVKIKGFEKAKADIERQEPLGCGGKTDGSCMVEGSSCPGRGTCESRPIGQGLSACVCVGGSLTDSGVSLNTAPVNSYTTPTPAPVNSYTTPAPVATGAVSLTKTGAAGLAFCNSYTDKCSNGNSCEPVVIGGTSYYTCSSSASGPSILNGTYSVTNVPAKTYNNIGMPVLVGASTITKTGAVGLTVCGSYIDKCSNGNPCEPVMMGGENVYACVSSVSNPLGFGANSNAY